jgi:ubiquinone/menaquinone biosynthesis C-methylase UbiE
LAGRLVEEESVTASEIREKIADLGPWFYPFEFGDGVRTTPAIPEDVVPIFDTRLRMALSAIEPHFGPRLSRIECLDIGCHEGFYSLAMARLGLRRVVGMDAREEILRRARFVAEAQGLGSIEYKRGLVEKLEQDEGRQYDLTLFLGILYHVENPMLCLRNVAAVTREMCVIETQVIDEVEGTAEWGARAWTRPYRGVIALIDESGEFHDGSRETGVTPLGVCPSPRALTTMLRHAGFRRVLFVKPPADAYEQHARGKRVVCAAWK